MQVPRVSKRNPPIPEHDMRYTIRCTDCKPVLRWIAHTKQKARDTAAIHTLATSHRPTLTQKAP
jgi:hypothetical protein